MAMFLQDDGDPQDSQGFSRVSRRSPTTFTPLPQIVELGLDYRDSWPHVEVTVAINEILQLDLKDLTFEADFAVYVDWLDPQLKLGQHYEYNAEKGKFELAPMFEKLIVDAQDDYRIFNPGIEIVNSKRLAQVNMPVPYIVDETNDQGNDVAWLSKKFEFSGLLSCQQVHARAFPFDVQGLQIRIRSVEMEGMTSLGQPRILRLSEPIIRKRVRELERKLHVKKAKTRMGWADMKIDKQDWESMSHMWRLNDEDGEAFGFGEMQLMAMGGSPLPEGNRYTFHLVLRRQWYPRYVFDFVIQNLQVIAATIGSLYIPFTSDMLANRMGIALMVLLTLVASTNARPSLIESVPYSTLHDTYGQCMVLLILFISVGNWFVFVACWGMYREFGVDDYWNEDLHMIVSNVRGSSFQEHGWCEEGWCGASSMDCVILLCQLGAQVLLIVGLLVWAQMARITTLLFIKNQVDEPDPDTSCKYSKLVLCDKGFMKTPRQEILDCARQACLLPGVWLFIHLWRKSRQCRRCLITVLPMQVDTFHAMDALKKLREADALKGLMKGELTTSISRFVGVFSRRSRTCFLDVGSGEMGFYSYELDQETDLIHASGSNNKLKYNKGFTFVDHFVDSPNGADALAKEIASRFQLLQRRKDHFTTTVSSSISRSPASPTRSNREMGTASRSLKLTAVLPGAVDKPLPSDDDDVDELKNHRSDRHARKSSDSTAAGLQGEWADKQGDPFRGSVTSMSRNDSQRHAQHGGGKNLFTILRSSSGVSEQSLLAPIQADGIKRVGHTTSDHLANVESEAGRGTSASTRVRSVSTHSIGTTAYASKKQKLLMCLTGANRQMLSEDAGGRQKLKEFVKNVNERIQAFGIEIVEFSPHDHDEAMYELLACEWVVQHGDLDVTHMRLGRNYRNLHQGAELGRVCLDEVLNEFKWLHADEHLVNAFQAASEKEVLQSILEEEPEQQLAGSHEVPRHAARGRKSSTTGDIVVTESSLGQGSEPADGAAEASKSEPMDQGYQRHLDSSGLPASPRSTASGIATKKVGDARGLPPRRERERQMDLDEAMVRCRDFYDQFEASPPLLRALVRSKEFVGTLSAGSGSCQVTLRETQTGGMLGSTEFLRTVAKHAKSCRSTGMHSIPLGNRTPVTTMKLKVNGDGQVSPFSTELPETRKRALALLCPRPGGLRRGFSVIWREPSLDKMLRPKKGRKKESPPSPHTPRASTGSGYIDTSPAWTEDGRPSRAQLEEWQELVTCCAEESNLPRHQRGLFVGITAVYYAAKLAGCADQILDKQEFLDQLEAKMSELLENDGTGRDLANLTLVHALVEHVLHHKGRIVCKRSWVCTPSDGDCSQGHEVVATWTLGLFLKHLSAV